MGLPPLPPVATRCRSERNDKEDEFQSDRGLAGRSGLAPQGLVTKEIKRTAFDRPQRAMGVVQHLDREGWYWPKHFGDPVAEHHAIRNDVGVWDASPLRKLAFSGPDA